MNNISRIKQFTMGCVVVDPTADLPHNNPGHVIGFTLIDSGKILIKVAWANGERHAFSPESLKLL